MKKTQISRTSLKASQRINGPPASPVLPHKSVKLGLIFSVISDYVPAPPPPPTRTPRPPTPHDYNWQPALHLVTYDKVLGETLHPSRITTGAGCESRGAGGEESILAGVLHAPQKGERGAAVSSQVNVIYPLCDCSAVTSVAKSSSAGVSAVNSDLSVIAQPTLPIGLWLDFCFF